MTEKKNRKVLFLDGWTGGIQNFIPLARELRSRGIDSLLVHLGSWGGDLERPREEEIEGIVTRDISYYETNLIHKILETERPQALVMLTTCYLKDRAAFASCRALGIKAVFMMHGIEELDVDVIRSFKASQRQAMRRKRFQLMGKFAKFVLPNYFYSGLKANSLYLFDPEPWRALYELFTEPEIKTQFPRPTPEIHADKALVYSKSYAEFYVKMFGYDKDKIEIIGLPSLDKIAEELDGDASSRIRRDFGLDEKPIICYVDDAFVESNVPSWSNGSRINFFKEIAAAIRETGANLLIKLHPGNLDKQEIIRVLTGDRCRVVDRYSLIDLIDASDAIVGHISTVLVSAIYLRKPIMVPRWGIGGDIQPRFVDFGVATSVPSLNEFSGYISHGVTYGQWPVVKQGAIDHYIDNNIGPVDGKWAARVVDAILQPHLH